MSSWSKNDKLFLSELKIGHQWQYLPALFFKLNNFDVEVPELKIRKSIKEASKFIDTVDLKVNGIEIEVKSRNESFTSPENFPYSTVFVDTVSGFNNKTNKPFAYVMISRSTGCMLWLPTSTYKKWGTEFKFDRVRKIREQFYNADKKLLKSMESLVKELNEKA